MYIDSTTNSGVQGNSQSISKNGNGCYGRLFSALEKRGEVTCQ